MSETKDSKVNDVVTALMVNSEMNCEKKLLFDSKDDVCVKLMLQNETICEKKSEVKEEKGLKGDYTNLCILLLLYTLQGIPFGLLTAIPMILSSNKVGYEKQAIFSLAHYPYTIKLLWAPIADSVYWKRFGRRKSWLIPTQYFIAVLLMVLSSFIMELIGSKTEPPQISLLTVSMFVIIFFTATQDIAVDAWALTLLSRRNVHFASSCNSVGLSLGRFISTTIFLSLESAQFCNKWLRTVPKESGILNIEDYFFVMGLVFGISTTVIWLCKKEEHKVDEKDEVEGICNTYRMFLKIIKLKGVLAVAAIHFTQFIAFAAVSNVTDLKLIQFGVQRDTLSLLKAPIILLNIILPFLVVQKIKKTPMLFFYRFGIARLCFGLIPVAVVYWTQTFNNPKDGFPTYFYIMLFIALFVFDIFEYSHSMCLWAFCTMVADPVVGATYMTLFSTLALIGMKWTATVSLWLVEFLTIRQTVSVSEDLTEILNSTVSQIINGTSEASSNITTSTRLITVVDGFYVEAGICFLIGIIWFIGFKKLIWKLQHWPRSIWRVANVNVVKNNLNATAEEQKVSILNLCSQ